MKYLSLLIPLIIMLVGCSTDKSSDEKIKEDITKPKVTDNDSSSINSSTSLENTNQQKINDETFEKNMIEFDEKLNTIQEELVYYVENMDSTTPTSMIQAFDDAISYILQVENYSDSEKYGTTYKTFIRASSKLTLARTAISDSVNSQDTDRFNDGLKYLASAIELYKETGKEFAEAYNQ
ncbi:hypothetical protein [Niallia circulans]|uniref:hypothetical protein n=1 Tax=Niallia circulans TaxID=1397 RepID=UPI0026E9D652|nr:hypothetical protein [Niallia circulans]